MTVSVTRDPTTKAQETHVRFGVQTGLSTEIAKARGRYQQSIICSELPIQDLSLFDACYLPPLPPLSSHHVHRPTTPSTHQTNLYAPRASLPTPLPSPLTLTPPPTTVAPAGQNSSPQAEQYRKGTLSLSSLSPSPFTQFHTWFLAAQRSAAVPQPETVCLSTAALPSGSISSRYVYLKELDRTGFVIYSNWGTSRKAADVASNPQASLAFWWPEQERQIRVEGPCERLSREESQVYYRVRARGSKIGAWASEQSKVLREEEGGREILEGRIREQEERWEGKADEEIECPEFWGGLRVRPRMVEFWQGRESRLHDRFRYRRVDGEGEGEGEWVIERLSP